MKLREALREYSFGNNLCLFWRMFRLRERVPRNWQRAILTFLLNRFAHRHGGYVGSGAQIDGIPILPHGLHGVYISRYAHIGADCWIYQNVTIGESGRRAPCIGDRCLIGANAVLIGGITIGSDVRIGAGAVVAADVPDGATVIAQPPRIRNGDKKP